MAADNAKKPLELWVKAGSDGIRNGGCPVCQHIFLVLLLKSNRGALHFNAKTTNPHKPYDEFKATGARHVPVLVHGDEVLKTVDDILEYIDSAFPKGSLQYFNPEADTASENVFAKFCWYLKEVHKDPHAVNHELAKLDAYLKESEHKFMCGEEMCHLDCHLLPKLHHMRIAGGYLKDFTIPAEFSGVWKYLKHGYECSVFQQSCPSDQEIILHWADRPDTPNITMAQSAELANQPPINTWSIPDGVHS